MAEATLDVNQLEGDLELLEPLVEDVNGVVLVHFQQVLKERPPHIA